MDREGILAMIMGSLKEINQDAQANGVRPSTLPDGDPSIARQLGRHVILVGFFVATQGQSQKAKTWIDNDSGVCVERLFLGAPCLSAALVSIKCRMNFAMRCSVDNVSTCDV